MSLYNSTRWRKRRKQQLQAEPLCRMCEEQGRTTPATVADHIERHGNDPDKFWYGDLQSLCKLHHDSTKQRYEKTGVMPGCTKDGIPLDPKHHWR